MNFRIVSFTFLLLVFLGSMFESFSVNIDHFDVFVIVVDDDFSCVYNWFLFDLNCLLDKFDVFFI